jgi:Protein of unknown function (DUF2975)
MKTPASPVGSMDSNREIRFGTQVTSRALAWFCLLLAAMLPLGSLYYMSTHWPFALMAALGDAALPNRDAALFAATSRQLMIAAAVGMAPVALMSYAMTIAYRCFSGFARGEYFTHAAVRHLRGFARAMFGAALACLIVPPLVGLIITIGSSGQASLVVSLGSQHLVLLVFAGVVWQMASVMAKAVALAEENAQFV